MRAYDLTQVADAVLRRDLPALNAQERAPTAIILAHIAEYDSRALYLADGYPSMFAYCVDALRRSDDSAYRRITAARAARRFPALFTQVADGSQHLTGILIIAPYLTPENAAELIHAAAMKTKSQIQQLVAQRFAAGLPRPKPQIIRAMPTPPVRKLAPARVDNLFAPPTDTLPVQPIAPPEERFEVRFSTGRAAHDRLRYAQSLLSHAVPCGDLEQIYDRAVICLIAQLKTRKFAATEHPRAQGQNSRRKRNIPAEVKRAVWMRDQGRCTFVGQTGHRCRARQFVEYDHVDPVALGGKATVDRIRLRCRAHNQYEAEKVFGVTFMRRKRARNGARSG